LRAKRAFAILGHAMPAALPIPVLVHLAAAASALVLGFVMLARRKGTPSHKALGRIWVAVM
jgi:uncharacterized membrane protein